MCPSRVCERSHDLAAVVDPGGRRASCPGDIDGGEVPSRIHEAMSPSRVCERSHDLAAVVDPGGLGGTTSPGDIDGCDLPARVHEGPTMGAHDLAAVVDP